MGGLIIEKSNRTIFVTARVTEAENALIEEKMQVAGIANRGAYIRKMILNLSIRILIIIICVNIWAAIITAFLL